MSGRGLSNRRTNNNNDAEPSVRRSLRVRDRNPAFPGGMPDTPRRSRRYERNPIEPPALVAATDTILIVAVAPEPIVDREEELASLEGGGEAARRVAESAAESEARDAEVATLSSMAEAYREALEASNDNASALREQVIGLEVTLADTIARMERASEDRERIGARDGAAYETRLSAYVDAENALMIKLDEKEGIIASLTKERDDGLAQIKSLRLELAALKSKADSAMESQLAIIAEKSPVEITYAAPTPSHLAQSFIEEECTATFDPVIQLEEVEMKSGEEEEEVLCSYHSKLFQFGETLLDKGTGKKDWMERGIGEARILRHRGNGRLRFLMRCEKTKKVIANHALHSRIELKPYKDKSWIWVCLDVAHGESQQKVFALRFANSEVAGEFKAKFKEYQAKM